MKTITSQHKTAATPNTTRQQKKPKKNRNVAPQTARVTPSKGKAGKNAAPATEPVQGPKQPAAAGEALQVTKQPAAAKTDVAKTDGARKASKTSKVLDLLKRAEGATLKEIMTATGWQGHSVRGFISGTLGKKMGLTVSSTKGENGERTYSVQG